MKGAKVELTAAVFVFVCTCICDCICIAVVRVASASRQRGWADCSVQWTLGRRRLAAVGPHSSTFHFQFRIHFSTVFQLTIEQEGFVLSRRQCLKWVLCLLASVVMISCFLLFWYVMKTENCNSWTDRAMNSWAPAGLTRLFSFSFG